MTILRTILRSEIQTAKAVGSARMKERVTRRKAYKHGRVMQPLAALAACYVQYKHDAIWYSIFYITYFNLF